MKMQSVSFCAAAIALVSGTTAFAQTPAPAGSGTAFPARTQDTPPSAPAALPSAALNVPDNYRLDVEDTINIEVFRHSDVSRSFRISSDGRVRLLRLQSPVVVQGKTCAEVADELTKRLQSEGKLRLRPGQVVVSVVGMRTRRVYIRGNAIGNREIDLKNGWRITELVAEIGGVPQPDRIPTVRLQNVDKNLRPEPLNLDLNQILNHPDSPQNVPLLEGDTLYMQGPQVKRLVIEGAGPAGAKDFDERYNLRQSLVYIGFSTIGAGGDLKNAKLWHYTKPGDPTSPRVAESVDLYTLLTDKKSPDFTYNDLDTLEIPVSQRFVYVQGAFAGPSKILLPEDRKTYLADIMAQGSTNGVAKIGDVKVRRYAEDGTMTSEKSYDWGKYKTNGDQKQNPEILAGDMVFVPNVKRTDPSAVPNAIFTGWGIFNIFKALVPGGALECALTHLMSDKLPRGEAATTKPSADPIIVVDNVSKRFDLHAHRSTELRERFGSLLRRGNQGRLAQSATPDDIFWALRDVSFVVEPGQPVGVVGHNGSGKSTMLKLLTGIMKPTQGSIKVKGRIGALIEVGAGFHPDLTGRENVYLSGSILGLSRRDIDSRFDRIVQFASLERFIDTPVKRYSSGMYMRLGFSVAAHTDPDVLLIDEVLAVGDTLFQRKCLGYLKEFVRQGGAVVFVSHAMAQVAELCKTCVWLDHGQVRYVGETEQAIEQYMAVVDEREAEEWKRSHPEEWELMEAERKEAEEAEQAAKQKAQEDAEREAEKAEREAAETARAQAARLAREEAERIAEAEREAQAERDRITAHLADYNRPRILGVTLAGRDGRPRTRFVVGESVEIHMRYQFLTPPPHPVLNAEFWRDDGLFCFGTSNFDHEIDFAGLPLRGDVKLTVQYLALNAGTYRLRLRQFCDYTRPEWISYPDDIIENALEFTVEAGMFGHGATYLPTSWEFPRPLAPLDLGSVNPLTAVSHALPPGAKEVAPINAKSSLK